MYRIRQTTITFGTLKNKQKISQIETFIAKCQKQKAAIKFVLMYLAAKLSFGIKKSEQLLTRWCGLDNFYLQDGSGPQAIGCHPHSF